MDKTELMTTAAPTTDGIAGYTDEVTGQETKKSSLFRGTRIKFSKTSEWEIDGEAIDPEIRLILIDVARIVTRWGPDKKPLETIVLALGEKWPDHEAWNDALPNTEWVQGMNGLRGPWQPQQIVYFLDPQSMSQYHWADGTVGGAIGIREAVDSIKAMRRFRPGAAPVVEFSTTFFPTRYGGRQRPFFVIHSWVTMPGEEPQPAALPGPVTAPTSDSTAAPVVEATPTIEVEPVKAAPAKVAEPAKAAKRQAAKAAKRRPEPPFDPVKPVTIDEELNDEIGF
jgi:hypothetical protein